MHRFMKRSSSFIAVLAALILTGVATAQHAVSGRVVDEADRPVSGAHVATFWQFDGGTPDAFGKMETGEDGWFSGEIRYYDRPTALLAINADGTRGGIVIVNADNIDEPLVIQLGPLVHVYGTLTSEGLGYTPEWTNVYMSLQPGPMRIAACSSSEGEFSFTLPPGEYYFWAYGRDLQNYTNQSMTLSADQGEVNLGAIDIQPSIIAQHYGKAPPKWNVTDARGAKPGVQPADYKGKWLLLEFWGYW